MNQKLKFIISMCYRQWRMRYYCFGLFKSESVNIFLVWTLLPVSLIAYHLTYSVQDIDMQWYIYFVSQHFYIFLLSVIVFNIYKRTRHAGISTAILLKSLFALCGELLGLDNKFSWISVVWNFIICALLFVGVYDYYTKTARDESSDDKGIVYDSIVKAIHVFRQIAAIWDSFLGGIGKFWRGLIDKIKKVLKRGK